MRENSLLLPNVNIQVILERIKLWCNKHKEIVLNSDIYLVFNDFFEEDIMSYKRDNIFDDNKVAVMSKSVSNVLPVSDVFSLLRQASIGNDVQYVITKDDMTKAIALIRY